MAQYYIGDGVYVEFADRDTVILKTWNGMAVTNRIVLEYDMCESLLKYLEIYLGKREPPHQTDCICADCSGAELTADND